MSVPARSIKKARHNRTDFTELAVSDIHLMVGELRHIGLGVYTSLRDIAAKLRMGKQRVAHLYYRNQPVLITHEQQQWIAAGAVRVLTHLGDEHMRAAARCAAKAEKIRERQSQLDLPLGDAKCAPGVGTFSLRAVA